jgi:hypothetical protein
MKSKFLFHSMASAGLLVFSLTANARTARGTKILIIATAMLIFTTNNGAAMCLSV